MRIGTDGIERGIEHGMQEGIKGYSSISLSLYSFLHPMLYASFYREMEEYRQE
jgi:hypothetical protein